MSELEMITVTCPSGYKFPLQVDFKNKSLWIPTAFLREVLKKKFKDYLPYFAVDDPNCRFLAKQKTSRNEELKALIDGLNYVLDMLKTFEFSEYVKVLKNPKLLEVDMIGKTRIADKDMLSNIDLENQEAIKNLKATAQNGSGGCNGNNPERKFLGMSIQHGVSTPVFSDQIKFTNGAESAPIMKDCEDAYELFFSYPYSKNKGLFNDSIIQIKESEVYELKAENESLKVSLDDAKLRHSQEVNSLKKENNSLDRQLTSARDNIRVLEKSINNDREVREKAFNRINSLENKLKLQKALTKDWDNRLKEAKEQSERRNQEYKNLGAKYSELFHAKEEMLKSFGITEIKSFQDIILDKNKEIEFLKTSMSNNDKHEKEIQDQLEFVRVDNINVKLELARSNDNIDFLESKNKELKKQQRKLNQSIGIDLLNMAQSLLNMKD